MMDADGSLAHLDDLEVYIKGATIEACLQWLLAESPSLTVTRQNKRHCQFTLESDNGTSAGMIYVNAGNTGFTSVWLKHRIKLWADDVSMGRAAHAALGLTVRCVESAWQQGDDPDQYLEIAADGEKLVTWPNEGAG